MLAAIEIFNKPKFEYREEAFAILAVNAWELLLKAKITADSPKGERAIYERRSRDKDGRLSQKQYIQRTASGLPRTISLKTALQRLRSDCLPHEAAINLESLVEIRDSATHAHALSSLLSQKVLELGTACVRNYVVLVQRWFCVDLRGWKLSLMPIGFIDSTIVTTGATISPVEKQILEHLSRVAATAIPVPDTECQVSIKLRVEVAKGVGTGAITVVQTKDPDALKITITDEDFQSQFPWSYRDLVARCKDRYIDFKQDSKFHRIRKAIVAKQTVSKTRILNPRSAKSAKQNFFSTSVLGEFDSHYKRRRSSDYRSAHFV